MAPKDRQEVVICEYRECHGPVETALPWKARIRVTVGRKEWLVCERCADTLTRKNSPRKSVTREPLG